MKSYSRWTRTLVVLAFLLCVVSAPVLGRKAGGFYVSISETRREHSRDSYSISKTITISGNALLYEESGRHSKQVHKEYELTNQEIVKLRQLISERNLLISRSVEYPEATGPHTSIVLSLELKLNRKRSLIRISGSINSKELENDRVYKNAAAFLEEIIHMIQAKDESKPR
jgi:hypothetical protein